MPKGICFRLRQFPDILATTGGWRFVGHGAVVLIRTNLLLKQSNFDPT